jgi:glutamate carboxypeptidase
MAKVKANAAQTVVPDTTVEVSSDPAFPPFFQDATGDDLTRRAQSIYAEIGRRLETHGTGGASESALAQAVGTPALDGLGFVGGDFHTDHEWIAVSSIPARIYLTARLIEELGAKPPVKASK